MLAPAGNRIRFSFDSKPFPEYRDYSLAWCQSGTAALALAIMAAKLKKPVDNPEVIIPAYACPDLVSAAAYANTQCRLCDLDINNTAYSLDEITSCINDNTVAIVAVNFLGIEERLQELKKLADENQILLIEDNAQWFPELKNNESLTGDCVSLSFGRGKPVSMLGGGLTLFKNSLLEQTEIQDLFIRYQDNLNKDKSASFFIKSLLYNILITPFCYGLLNYVPGLELGVTKYKSLESISAFQGIKRKYLGLNALHHMNSEPTAQLYLQTHLEALPEEIISLPNRYLYRTKRLLRYPILFEDEALRDIKYKALTEAGLGASKLYNTTLPKIAGTEDYLCEHQDLPNAHDFAKRLLTLPIHNLVETKHLEKMVEILNH